MLIIALAAPYVQAKKSSKKVQNTALLQDEYDECCSSDNSCYTKQEQPTTQSRTQQEYKEESFVQSIENYATSFINWIKSFFICTPCNTIEKTTSSSNNDESIEEVETDTEEDSSNND